MNLFSSYVFLVSLFVSDSFFLRLHKSCGHHTSLEAKVKLSSLSRLIKQQKQVVSEGDIDNDDDSNSHGERPRSKSSMKSYQKFLQEQHAKTAQKEVKSILGGPALTQKERNVKGNRDRAAMNRAQLDQFNEDNAPKVKSVKLDRRHGRTGLEKETSRPKVKRDSSRKLTFEDTVVINTDQSLMSVDDMPFSDTTKAVLKREKGFFTMTAVQSQSYSHVHAGRNVVVRSRTGTGKTLAFGLPLLEKLLEDKNKGGNPSILILEPTRELALQVAQELSIICRAHGLVIATIYGGVSFDDQEKILQRGGGADIIVATPGRTLDHITRQTLDVGSIKNVVLDESDVMLELGFQKYVETILANIKHPGTISRKAAADALIEMSNNDDKGELDDSVFRQQEAARDFQMLLFSATMPGWINQLTDRHMKNPIFLDAVISDDTSKLPDTITHHAIRFAEGKRNLKAVVSCVQDCILSFSGGGKTIIFTNTKIEADNLVKSSMLAPFAPQALHGGMSQGARQEKIRQFKTGKLDVLIATDVASRGLDVADVDLVIHTRPPDDLDTYIHRSGRTGRAGNIGNAVLIHASSKREVDQTKSYEEGCNFEFNRRLQLSPDELIDASRAYAIRKNAYTDIKAIKKKREREKKLEAKGYTIEPTAEELVRQDQAKKLKETRMKESNNNQGMVGKNWAVDGGVVDEKKIQENLRLRNLYESELATGMKSDLLDEDQRARAAILLDRYNRKKARRAAISEYSKSDADDVDNVNNSYHSDSMVADAVVDAAEKAGQEEEEKEENEIEVIHYVPQ